MKRLCECGRPVHISVVTRKRSDGVEHAEDHSLCSRCYRSLRNRVVSARMLPMPLWAARQRSTLWRLQAQQEGHVTGAVCPAWGNPLEVPYLRVRDDGDEGGAILI